MNDKSKNFVKLYYIKVSFNSKKQLNNIYASVFLSTSTTKYSIMFLESLKGIELFDDQVIIVMNDLGQKVAYSVNYNAK